MASDEIFVLILVSICVAIVVAMSFRSRRRAGAAVNPESPVVSEAAAVVPENVAEPEVRRRKRKRR
jgi:hypothetical protein